MLAYESTTLETEAIVDACLDRYRAAGLPARSVAWNRLAVDEATGEESSVIISDEYIDWVLTDQGDPGAHRPVFRRLVADGWQIHVLVPLERMGEAHRGLRGVDVRLQGWWLDDGSVHFGQPEIP